MAATSSWAAPPKVSAAHSREEIRPRSEGEKAAEPTIKIKVDDWKKEFRKPVFEERGYGFRLILSSVASIIIIGPHTDTAAGIDSGSLNRNGLRGHGEISSEQIKVIGFADEGANGIASPLCPLIYRYEDNAGAVRESGKRIGDEFYSVDENGKGNWHVLENQSNRPIMLLVKAMPKLRK